MKKKVILTIIFFFVLLNYFSWSVVFSYNNYLEVIFFDVGQGDTALIKTPKGHKILIDGGPGNIVLEKIDKEIPFFNRKIDLIILTHPHYDHISGLIEVLKNYSVDHIIYTGVIDDTEAFSAWDNLVGDDYITARAGLRVLTDDFHIDILYPFENFRGEYVDDSNCTSVVSRLVYGKDSFLFTGDIYSSDEEELIFVNNWCKKNEALLCRSINLSSDVLKVGHHGSKTSTSKDFLSVVHPSLAVISVGEDNRHEHPHKEVLQTLEEFNISTRRTDIHGDVRVISYGI